MKVYDQCVLPCLIHSVMNSRRLDAYRRRLAIQAKGVTLEIGFGSGRNLPFYIPDQVERLYALEPDANMLKLGQKDVSHAPFPIEILHCTAEHIPLPDRSIDTALCSWTLCSVPDIRMALHEIRRVLKPDGYFAFCEHGLASDPGVARWQQKLTPMWSRFVGGCHLDRSIDELLRDSGFRIARLENSYQSMVKPMSYMYEGLADLEGAKSTADAL